MSDQTSVETDMSDWDRAGELNPLLTRCQFNLMVQTYDIESLREGLDIASLNMGRYGFGGFFVIATNPANGEQWVVDGDRVYPMAEWENRAAEEEPDEDVLLEAAAHRITKTTLKEDPDAPRPE